jgi:hypothetical protein
MDSKILNLGDGIGIVSFHVPIKTYKIGRESVSSSGSSNHDEEAFTEYFIDGKVLRNDRALVAFNAERIRQYHTFEEYDQLLKEKEGRGARGKISLDLMPFVYGEGDSVSLSVDGLVKEINLRNVPLCFEKEAKTVTWWDDGKISAEYNFSIDFNIPRYRYKMPEALGGFLPDRICLFSSEDNYLKLLERRNKERESYGNVVLRVDPLGDVLVSEKRGENLMYKLLRKAEDS